ncbi:regulatory protein RecX [Marinitoga litoralis]|jgi:regulatory protein|uniref:regulatory protein RecX n=1 Tax=Marinitoga litoralis TaxID=570855 RepID=UPI0019618C9E|nr:regulatory protein RecX [Marinitoga litoralis]MBM7560118.1 regulatory protein [Marinitoga litoralis]
MKKKIDPFDESAAQRSALNLLKFRPRSEYELKQRLLEKGFAEETINNVILKLKEFKMVDDALFAYLYAYDKMTYNKKGPKLIRLELINKFHIDEDLVYKGIEKALEEVDLKEIIREIIKKKENYNEKRKIKEYLYKKGFDSYIIEEVLNEVGGE